MGKVLTKFGYRTNMIGVKYRNSEGIVGISSLDSMK